MVTLGLVVPLCSSGVAKRGEGGHLPPHHRSVFFKTSVTSLPVTDMQPKLLFVHYYVSAHNIQLVCESCNNTMISACYK